ncbi:MAG: hypothetical protein P8099_18835 [Gemmatimonadota bacterium]
MKLLSDRTTMRRLVVLAVLATLVPLSDCSLFGRRTSETRDTATVEVRNGNWLNMNIYLVRNGNRVRVGGVDSFDEATFELEAARLHGSDIRLLADPIGSPEYYLSPAIMVNPGQTVRLEIKNVLSLSTVAVY